MEGFNTKRELDKHIMDKHIFICGECLKTFKIKAERDTHMKTDHKDVSTEMTKQEKLLAEEYRKRESREENDRQATETWKKVWSKYAAKKERQVAEEKKQRKGSLQPHKPKKRQNVPRAMTKMRTKTTSPQKNQAVRTHCTSQPKRSSREQTRKATSELYIFFMYFSLQVKN